MPRVDSACCYKKLKNPIIDQMKCFCSFFDLLKIGDIHIIQGNKPSSEYYLMV